MRHGLSGSVRQEHPRTAAAVGSNHAKRAFDPRLDMLPLPQRRLWDELSVLPDNFVLYGGTAIALHLGHRQSVDFDFFIDAPLDPSGLLPSLPLLSGAIVTQREPNTITCTIDRGGIIKLSFFGEPNLPRLSQPLIARDNGLRVASLLDLAGTKATVVQLRAEAKDYLDIDALIELGGVELPMALAAAVTQYGSAFNPQNALKALCFFDDGNLRHLPGSVKDRLVRPAAVVDLDRLPVLVPLHGGSGTAAEPSSWPRSRLPPIPRRSLGGLCGSRILPKHCRTRLALLPMRSPALRMRT